MTLRRRLVDWSLAALFLLIPALVLRSSLRHPNSSGKTVPSTVAKAIKPSTIQPSGAVKYVRPGYAVGY